VAVWAAVWPLAEMSLTLEVAEAVNDESSLSSEERLAPVAVAMTDWYDDTREAASPVTEAILEVTSESMEETRPEASEARDEAAERASLARDSILEVMAVGTGLVRVTSWAAARAAKAAIRVVERMVADGDGDGVGKYVGIEGIGCG